MDVDFTKRWYLQCFIEPDSVVCRSCAGIVDVDFTKRWYLQCFIELDIVVCRSCAGLVDLDFTKRWYLQCFIEPDIVVWLVGWFEKGVFRSPEALKEYRKGF